MSSIEPKRSATRQLAILALLVSLDVVLSRMGSIRIPMGGIEGIRIGFGAFPIVFAGLAYGPGAGALVGAVGDLIGYFINPIGAYLPIFTVTAALRGFWPGLIWKLMGRRLSYAGAGVPIFVSGLSSALTVPLLLRWMFHLPLMASMPGSLVSMCLTVPLYTLFFVRLYTAMQKRGVL